MKRLSIMLLLLGGIVLLSTTALLAKKPPKKPVFACFEAQLHPPSHLGLTISINELSTEQEIQALASVYAKGGEDELQRAMGKSGKGHFKFDYNDSSDLRVIWSHSAEGKRTIEIIGVAPYWVRSSTGGIVGAARDRDRYPFSYIQLQGDDRNNWTGIYIPFVRVLFAPNGEIQVKPDETGVRGGAVPLDNVHPVS